MNVGIWLENCTRTLRESNVHSARLDCLILLEDISGKDRTWLLAHPEYELKSSNVKKLKEQIDRRAKHEPLAYIRGKSEFYGRVFVVNNHTLEPRPETETMLELLKELIVTGELSVVSKSKAGHRKQIADNDNLLVVDVGTGSGCIAITAKLEFPNTNVIGIDIDKKCLETAKKNAQSLGANIEFLQGNLLEPLASSHLPPAAILANLPYVPNSHTINQAAMHEPKTAIFGGQDGLDLYRELLDQIDGLEDKPLYIFAESLPPQHKKLSEIANRHGYELVKNKDLIQLFKKINHSQQ